MRTSRLRVSLCEVEPVVARTLDVPAGAVLPEIHDLLQAALGWTDSHLHQFVADGVRYGTPDIDAMEGERDETAVPLRSLPSPFRYLYDFGDGWEHEVEVLGPGGEAPGCVAGEGPCPPEDVGGPPGYAHFREVMADPDCNEHDQLRAWAGRWGDFDLADTDLWVWRTAGAVPATVRLVLDLASGGVKLTPGGRLPRAFVRQVQQHHPGWHLLDRPASVEEDLPPLAALHELLREVGLLRLRHRVLSPTRAAGDDTQVIRRLRSWFGPPAGFTHLLVTEALAILAAAGACPPGELAAQLFPLLGHRWVTGTGQPINERDLRQSLSWNASALTGLDLLDTSEEAWSVGPSALRLLPRTTGLVRYWSSAASQ